MTGRHRRGRVTTVGWDVAGIESGRMLRQFLLWRLFRFGFLDRGPGFVRLVELIVRTRLGRQLSWLTDRYQRQWLAVVGAGRRLERRARAAGDRLRPRQ
jgi:hypothetical protein